MEFQTLTSNNDGFDECPTPRWQMVPVGGTRTVRLIGGKDATVTVPPGRVASLQLNQVKGIDRELTIRGDKAGNGPITASLGGKKLTLDLAVKPAITKTIAFYFVKINGNPAWSTARDQSDVAVIIQGLNEIFTTQANVSFAIAETVLRNVAVPVSNDLTFYSYEAGEAVQFPGGGDYAAPTQLPAAPGCELVPGDNPYASKKSAPKANKSPTPKPQELRWTPEVISDRAHVVGDFRLFFVNEVKNVNSVQDTDGISLFERREIFCEDALGPGATGLTRGPTLIKVIAHEIAHILRNDKGHVHYLNPNKLLYREIPTDTKLTKDDINRINKGQ